jgi:hypothetical protein
MVDLERFYRKTPLGPLGVKRVLLQFFPSKFFMIFMLFTWIYTTGFFLQIIVISDFLL